MEMRLVGLRGEQSEDKVRKDETKGTHLATGLVSSQTKGMSIGGESGRGAGITRLGAGAQGDREVESEVHCVAHLGNSWAYSLEGLEMMHERVSKLADNATCCDAQSGSWKRCWLCGK